MKHCYDVGQHVLVPHHSNEEPPNPHLQTLASAAIVTLTACWTARTHNIGNLDIIVEWSIV